MITKTGIEYSENSDLSNSSTIEENGTVNSINIPSWETGVDLYCRAYVIEDGERVNSEIEHYLPQNYFYLKNEYAGQNTITFTKSTNAGTFRYSKDKSHWTTVNATTTVVMDEGEKVYLRGEFSSFNADSWYSIDCSEIYSIGGNIKTIDGGSNNPNTLVCIRHVFTGSTTLVDASEVDMSGITSIQRYGMENTFKGCSNLRKAPNMGSITWVGDNGMYCAFGETAIETIDMHSLTRVDSQAMEQAFINTPIHTVLMDNITTGKTGNLTQYIFRATFYNCTNLTKGIDLSNFTTVYTYNNHLYDIFPQMYSGCVNLSEATLPASYNQNAGTTYWLRDAGTNVSGTKTVYCPTGVSVPTNSDSGIPTGWTRADY